MTNEKRFSEYFGFTEEEVDRLYQRYVERTEEKMITRDELKSWYDGYHTQSGARLYNPRSIVLSLSNNNTSTIKIGDFPYRKKELEEKIASYMQSSLIDFINIMKTDYKMDLLNLGYIAASKYGRHKITDWDEEILKSTINVNVNFKISRFGLGRIVFD